MSRLITCDRCKQDCSKPPNGSRWLKLDGGTLVDLCNKCFDLFHAWLWGESIPAVQSAHNEPAHNETVQGDQKKPECPVTQDKTNWVCMVRGPHTHHHFVEKLP